MSQRTKRHCVSALTIIILLISQIVISTVFQSSAGVPFGKREMIGPLAGFAVLGLVSIGGQGVVPPARRVVVDALPAP